MTQRVPQVIAEVLHSHSQDQPEEHTIALDSPEWFDWLAQPTTRSFELRHALGNVTVRKERRQRGGDYWVAYHRTGRRLRKAYLGKSQQLTAARLHQAAAQLAGSGAIPALPAAPHHPQSDDDDPADSGTHANVLLATKLSIPPARPQIVRRRRLIGWLAQQAHTPLTLVVAPAGFGKTTLLAEWRATLTGRDVAVAWVSLDEADNDPAQFWSYVVAALRRIAAPHLAPETVAPLRSRHPAGLALTVAGVINALAASPRDITLILDDYHVISAPAIHESVAYLLEHLPPRLHLILSSRVEPPLPLARLRAHGHLAELRAPDLRCTRDEVTAFLQRVMGLQLAPEAVDLLAERTEGWLAGLQLAALALRGRPVSSGELDARLTSARDVEPYLVEEVLSRQLPEVQRFLLDTSVLARLCAPLCDAVTDGKDGDAMLRRLVDEQLFVIPLDAEGRWYRYHHLFAQVLHSRLRREAPEREAELCRRASAWHERHGAVPEAVRYALAAGDAERAADLIEAIALPTMWERGEVATVRGWLDALPAALLFARPRLALAYAHAAVYTHDVATAERIVRRFADAGAIPDDPPPELAAELAFLRAYLSRGKGDLDHSAALAREALRQVPTASLPWRAALTAELGHTYRIACDLPAAERTYEAAARLAQQSGNAFLAAYVMGCLALIHMGAGRLREAVRWCREVIQQTAGAADTTPAPYAALAYQFLGEVLYEWDELDDAARHAEQAAGLVRRVGDTSQLIMVDELLVRLHLARGDHEHARAVFAEADALGGPAPDLPRWKAAIRARWQIMTGGLEAAAAWAAALTTAQIDVAEAVETADAAPPPSEGLQVIERETVVRLRLAQGLHAEAAELAEQARAAVEARGECGQVITLLALEALAWQGAGDADRALVAIERALKLAEPERYTRLFVDLGAPMEALLRRAAAYGVAPAYARRLLAAFRVRPGARPTEHELAVLRLVAAGWSNHAIANHLVIAESTVKTHLRRVYAKLGASNRAHASALAREGNLL
ncbi:MAG TPA: LuxR C-terminal-related transcriptional regulator [Ktedonobacterales bacterium]